MIANLDAIATVACNSNSVNSFNDALLKEQRRKRTAALTGIGAGSKSPASGLAGLLRPDAMDIEQLCDDACGEIKDATGGGVWDALFPDEDQSKTNGAEADVTRQPAEAAGGSKRRGRMGRHRLRLPGSQQWRPVAAKAETEGVQRPKIRGGTNADHTVLMT